MIVKCPGNRDVGNAEGFGYIAKGDLFEMLCGGIHRGVKERKKGKVVKKANSLAEWGLGASHTQGGAICATG